MLGRRNGFVNSLSAVMSYALSMIQRSRRSDMGYQWEGKMVVAEDPSSPSLESLEEGRGGRSSKSGIARISLPMSLQELSLPRMNEEDAPDSSSSSSSELESSDSDMDVHSIRDEDDYRKQDEELNQKLPSGNESCKPIQSSRRSFVQTISDLFSGGGSRCLSSGSFLEEKPRIQPGHSAVSVVSGENSVSNTISDADKLGEVSVFRLLSFRNLFLLILSFYINVFMLFITRCRLFGLYNTAMCQMGADWCIRL